MQVRKLEFLMAEALEGGSNCVVTIGGIQSNHARATAVAARWGFYNPDKIEGGGGLNFGGCRPETGGEEAARERL
jgi:hypothetical protein